MIGAGRGVRTKLAGYGVSAPTTENLDVSIVAFGLSHRTAPLATLERVSVASERLPKLLHQLCSDDAVAGAVVLSTCNRTEVYLDAERFHDSYRAARDALAHGAGLAPEDIAPHLAISYDNDVVEHLFTVAAGLDSAVLGEHEILGQVREAWGRAREEGTLTPALDLLFRHAVEVGKRVRTETSIGRGTASVGQAAVELADQCLGGLSGRRAAVLGAGQIGSTVAGALAAHGVGDLAVVNRSTARAYAVAEPLGARSAGLDRLVAELLDADLLVTAVGSSSVVVDLELVELVLARRQERPLLVVDAGLPRNVAPDAASVPGVRLLDLDDVKRHAEAGLDQRRRSAEAAYELVEVALVRHLGVRAARTAGPMVAELRNWAESVRRQELERYRGRLSRLSERDLEVVEHLTRSLLGKLLHEPTVALKQAADTPRGARLADAVAELFRLEP
jgi:glutamyl-tRNA reductase